MSLFKKVVGWILLPVKFIFNLLDPILRFIEMAINIPLAFIIGNLVDLINSIPSIKNIHIGELILGIVSGVGFWLLNTFVLHFNIHIAVLILICIGVSIIGYFISYFFLKFVVNFVTSIVSFIIVVIRLAIYLPGSIWLTLIKLVVSFTTWGTIFFSNISFWTGDLKMITLAILLLFGISVFCSIIVLFIRKDVKFNSVGILGEVSLSELRAFTHSIGIYIMTLGVIPVYIGRAIEFNNGGLRKRIRDYQRGVNTHSSGTWIQNHLDELKIYIIELGHTGEDVSFVKNVEESLISSIYTKLNKVDASIGYVINFLGYLIALITFTFLSYIFIDETLIVGVLFAYFLVVMIVCTIIYSIENKRKWG